MVKINVQKQHEEFEIGDKVYQLSLSDSHLIKIKKESERISKEIEKVKSTERILAATKEILDIYFDQKGAGQEIYETCGKSTYIMTDVMNQIKDFITKKTDEIKAGKAAEYSN